MPPPTPSKTKPQNSNTTTSCARPRWDKFHNFSALSRTLVVLLSAEASGDVYLTHGSPTLHPGDEPGGPGSAFQVHASAGRRCHFAMAPVPCAYGKLVARPIRILPAASARSGAHGVSCPRRGEQPDHTLPAGDGCQATGRIRFQSCIGRSYGAQERG